ncbi:hypothetical protein HMI55_005539 [Coelomomyces lativittatus]|nr:hypothetical protein HMI55_005539 [Coelomomyces lativittatus]
MLPPPPPISSQSSSFITSISHPSKRRKFQSHPYSHPHAHSNPRSLYLKQHSLHLTSSPLLKIQSRKPHTTLLNTDSKHHKRRRSSLSRRGLRALDSENLAAPHSSIPVHDFFRHISPNLSDVKRAKLLLLLCGAKVLQLQKKSKHPIVLDFPVSSSTPPKKLVDLGKK